MCCSESLERVREPVEKPGQQQLEKQIDEDLAHLEQILMTLLEETKKEEQQQQEQQQQQDNQQEEGQQEQQYQQQREKRQQREQKVVAFCGPRVASLHPVSHSSLVESGMSDRQGRGRTGRGGGSAQVQALGEER